MFFDDKKTDTTYQNLLLNIAKKQQELFRMRFDWENRCCRPWPPKGLFGKDKKAIARYEAALQELEYLKSSTVSHRKRQGYTPGTFWWNLPWEQVEAYLMYDLLENTEDGAWRFSRNWEMIHDGELHMLVLLEEGHCSDFSSSRRYEYEEISKYSSSERDQMVRDYNKRLNNYELSQVMFDNDRPVRSVYGNTFASMSDYVLSGDHYFFRNELESSYRRSLYTEHHTNVVTVSSNSIHYKRAMRVGGFHLRGDGIPDYVSVMDFEPIMTRGDFPESLEEIYLQTDAAVVLAAYLADHSEYAAIPVQLFGKDIFANNANYSEAMRQSELYTCLAHKLTFTD